MKQAQSTQTTGGRRSQKEPVTKKPRSLRSVGEFLRRHKSPIIVAFTCLATLALLGYIATGCRPPVPQIPKTNIHSITVVIDNNYPPYSFLDAQGNLQGISIDQWKLWELKTGIEVNIVGMNWSDAMTAMEAGEFDVIDTIFYNEARAKIYDFTPAYATIEVPIYFNNRITGISDAASAKGFPVAVKSGDAVIDVLTEKGVTDLVYFDSYQQIIRAAFDQEVVVFAIDRPPADYFLFQYKIQDQFNSTAPLYSGQFHRAVKKDNAELLEIVNTGFANITAADYEAVNRKWFGTPGIDTTALKYSGYIIGGVLLILASLSIWNRSLQNQVRKKTKTLRESEASFRSLFDSSPISLWEQDFSQVKAQLETLKSEGVSDFRSYFHAHPEAVGEYMDLIKINRTNQASVELYGASSEEQLLTHLSVFLPEKLSEKFIDQLVSIASGSTSYKVETVNRTIEGRNIFVDLAWVVLPGHEDDMSRVIISLVDVTERKMSEEKLKASENKLRAIFAAIRDAIFIFDRDGKYLEVAPTNPTNLYLPAQDLVGKSVRDVLPEELARSSIETIERALKNKEITSMEYGLIIDGQEKWFQAVVSPMTRNSAIWAARDITEIKQKETQIKELNADLEKKVESRTKELKLKNKELEAFTYTVSHDLKAPLRGISGYADLLLQDHSSQLDDEGKGYLQKLIGSSQQLSQLIEDLLTYSRLERRPVVRENLKVKDLVGLVLEQRSSEIRDRSVEVHTDMEDEMINTSHELMVEIISNCLDNALKFTRDNPKPEVWINYYRDGAVSRLSIKDNGVGFDMKYKDKIFEVFQRLHTVDAFPGTGIGLALVKRAVDLLGYRIWAESEPGAGATFTMEINR
jgi:PAS domain S-box-containing protein